MMEGNLKVNTPLDPSKLLSKFSSNCDKLKARPAFKDKANCKLLDVCVECLEHYVNWAPDYDYSPSHQANGYWSIALIAIKLTDFVIDNEKHTHHLINVIKLFNKCFKFIEASRDESVSDKSNSLHSPSIPLLIDLVHQYMESSDAIIALSGPLCGFHLTASERVSRNAYMTLIGAHMASNAYEAMLCIASKEYRGQVIAKFAPKFDVAFTKRMLTIPELEPIKLAIPALLFWTVPSVVKNIIVKKRSDWAIGFDSEGEIAVRRAKIVDHRKTGTRCKYLLSGVACKEKSMLIDLHGGGFVGQSPETHEIYTRYWSTQLPGVPILSVDYCHAPENKFPTALQEILDVYLWLNDELCREEVASLIGFTPERIVLIGDSAGGNLAMALALILNDIRSQCTKDEPFKMIVGVVTCYACFSIKPTFSPSHFMTSVDPFLSAMVLFNLIDAYAPTSNLVNGKDSGEVHSWSSSSRLPQLSFRNNLMASLYDSARWLNPFSKSDSPAAWFACSKDELLDRIGKFGTILDHPYLSPIKYTKFQEMEDVSLHLVTLLHDPLLDDSIEMAKKWKGTVTLDVFDELNHGFLHFIHNSQEAMAGCDLVLCRLKQALKVY